MPASKRSSSARGYGYAHQQERERWRPIVEAGEAWCSRCRKRIPPGAPWDLDHTSDRSGYLGPACRSCNRAAGARTRNAQAKQRRQPRPSRDW